MKTHRKAGFFLASAFFAVIGMVTMGCKNNNNIPKMYSVTIGAHTNGTLTATVKGSTRTIKSGDQVTKGTVIVFTAKANTGYVFDKWIGALSGTTTPAELTVEKNVTVCAILPPPPPPPDNNSQSSNNSNNNNGGSSGGGNGSGSGNGGGGNGTTPPSQGGGGETNPGTGSEQGAEQTYSVTIEKPEHGTLSAKIGDSDITAPKKQERIKKGTKVTFIAEPAANFKIKKWIGLPEGADQTNPAKQTVMLDKDLTVKVEFELEPVPEGNIRIIYDAAKITCTQGTLPLYSDRTVAENTQLTFAAVSSTTEIDHWFVNNMEKSSDKTFSYTVTAADATDRTITVTYKEKEYPKLTFDSAKIEVKTFDTQSKTLSSGDKVSYLQSLLFKAKLSPGSSIDKWMINDTDKTDKFRPLGNNDYSYTVALEDVKDGTLHVTFTEKTTVHKKITFDSNTIAVFIKKGSNPPTSIASGTEISEGDTLAFSAILPFGTVVKEWKINDKKIAGSQQYVGYYLVKTEDLSSTDMTVSITTKNPSTQGMLKLGANVTCKKVKTPIPETTEELHDGDQIQETDILYVQSSETGTGIWKINGERERPLGKSPKVQTPLQVEAKHFKNGEIKIEFIKSNP